MTSLTLDTGMVSRLQNLGEFMEFRDESGRLLGYFHPAEPTSSAPASACPSPFSDDELRQRQQQRCGKPLAEVLAKFSAP